MRRTLSFMVQAAFFISMAWTNSSTAGRGVPPYGRNVSCSARNLNPETDPDAGGAPRCERGQARRSRAGMHLPSIKGGWKAVPVTFFSFAAKLMTAMSFSDLSTKRRSSIIAYFIESHLTQQRTRLPASTGLSMKVKQSRPATEQSSIIVNLRAALVWVAIQVPFSGNAHGYPIQRNP